MSRKLLFVSGLLTVFSCYKNGSLQVEGGNDKQYLPMIQNHLTNFVCSTSLDIMIWSLQQLGLSDQAGAILDQYDEFLKRLDDERIRDNLGKVVPQAIYEDKEFLEIRDVSHKFQDALNTAFFTTDTELREFTML